MWLLTQTLQIQQKIAHFLTEALEEREHLQHGPVLCGLVTAQVLVGDQAPGDVGQHELVAGLDLGVVAHEHATRGRHEQPEDDGRVVAEVHVGELAHVGEKIRRGPLVDVEVIGGDVDALVLGGGDPGYFRPVTLFVAACGLGVFGGGCVTVRC